MMAIHSRTLFHDPPSSPRIVMPAQAGLQLPQRSCEQWTRSAPGRRRLCSQPLTSVIPAAAYTPTLRRDPRMVRAEVPSAPLGFALFLDEGSAPRIVPRAAFERRVVP